MNWTIFIAETIVMTIDFTAMILIPLVKNPECSSVLFPAITGEGLRQTFSERQ